ncbi:MAG: penicillin acylase family protein [Acidobacteriaceae bacterium]|nr:penicillin acylase family protein [Acidobacteriaceae bacterium]
MLTRVVRIINVSIAILVVLIAVAVYWYALRPLPKTSGEISAPIGGAAVIKRDARGVPHIEAGSWQDAVFLQGFATAEDRLWQMDGLRRFGDGELAEVFGRGVLSSDERSRRMRMRALAEAAVQRLSPEDRSVFVQYARGVNYFINSAGGRYPLEFSIPGQSYDPKPWTVADSIVVGLVMYRQLTDSAGSDLERAALFAHASNPERMRLLFPGVQGGPLSPGSNAWAVSGAHTVDGKPMLANDTHLEYGIPPTWYLVHLKAPGLNVTGCSLPGVPGVILGHNEQIAWGVTNLQSDVMDLYAEQLDQRSGRYIYQGKVEQAQLDEEFIGVRGQKPVRVDVWITRHGPILASEGGKSFAMRWTASDGFSFPFWAIDNAHNWGEFRSAVQQFWGPPQNFVYADRAGNIGYQAAGRVPIRRDFDGDVPLDGASGKYEWDGYIPTDQMPSLYNPASGVIATSNQNPFPADYPYRVSGSYADPYRVRQVRARLLARSKVEVRDVLAIQKDVYSVYDHFLARQLVAAVHKHPSNDALVKQAIPVLENWNGQMDRAEAAPMITELVSNELGSALVLSVINTSAISEHGQLAPTADPKQGNVPSVRPKGEFVPPIFPRPFVIQHLLEQRPSGWVPGDDWDQWLIGCLGSALEHGRSLQGTPVSRWRWGRALEWTLAHPVGKQLPLVNGYFDIGPVEMSGSGTTVKQTTKTLGPSERVVVDFGDLEKSVADVTTGESGHVASPHYKDQWPAYYVGTSFPMEFQHVDAKQTLHVTPQSALK